MVPILSAIMPTYNGEKFITQALASVRQQDLQGIEVVVVDDGSSDRTLDIVHDFGKTLPIRVITPGRVGNWVAATNIGLREARGEWACFLHQDDLWLPGRIARLRPELESAKGPLVFHNAIFVGPDGRALGPWTCPLSEGDVPSHTLLERLLVQDFIAICSPAFRRSAVIKSGGLDEALWLPADWDLWLRLAAMGPARFIAPTLSAVRIHPASQTMARDLLPNEWELQLNRVLTRHWAHWARNADNGQFVKRVAMASIAVNSAAASVFRRQPARAWLTAFTLAALGPAGWHRYLRDSRIFQRAGSRLRMQWHRRPRETSPR